MERIFLFEDLEEISFWSPEVGHLNLSNEMRMEHPGGSNEQRLIHCSE
jgi:hypothetical protein